MSSQIPASWTWIRKGLSVNESFDYFYTDQAQSESSPVQIGSAVAWRKASDPIYIEGIHVFLEFNIDFCNKKMKCTKMIVHVNTVSYAHLREGLFMIEAVFYMRGLYAIGVTTMLHQYRHDVPQPFSVKAKLAFARNHFAQFPAEGLHDRLKEITDTNNAIYDKKSDLIAARELAAEAQREIKKLQSGMKGCQKNVRANGFDINRPGELYILRSTNGMYWKIGIAQRAADRHRSLRNVTPWDFEVIKVMHGSGADVSSAELQAHQTLAQFNCGFKARAFNGATEWFHDSPEVQAYIDALVTQGLDAHRKIA